MTRITLEIPNETALALEVPPEDVAAAVCLAVLAGKLFEMRTVFRRRGGLGRRPAGRVVEAGGLRGRDVRHDGGRVR